MANLPKRLISLELLPAYDFCGRILERRGCLIYRCYNKRYKPTEKKSNIWNTHGPVPSESREIMRELLIQITFKQLDTEILRLERLSK